MKNISVLFLLAINILFFKDVSASTLSSEECFSKILSSPISDTYKNIIRNQKSFVLNFLNNCISDDYSLVYGIVAAHEAVHAEDLGFFRKGTNVNLISLNEERIGKVSRSSELIAPNKVINKTLSNTYPELLENDDSFLSDMHNGYLLDLEAGAAQNFEFFLSELNAYTHGLRFEYEIRPLLENKNTITSSQVDGLYYFLTVLDVYLGELKAENGDSWRIISQVENRRIIQKLLLNANKVLREIDHCNQADNSYYGEDWNNFIRKSEFSSLKSIIPKNSESLVFNCGFN